MLLTDSLRRDHRLLRRQLEFLDVAIREPSSSHTALRDVTALLVSMFDSHIQCEERLLEPYRWRVEMDAHFPLTRHHQEQRRVCTQLRALCTDEPSIRQPDTTARIAAWMLMIRKQIADEERHVFPVVEQASCPDVTVAGGRREVRKQEVQ